MNHGPKPGGGDIPFPTVFQLEPDCIDRAEGHTHLAALAPDGVHGEAFFPLPDRSKTAKRGALSATVAQLGVDAGFVA